MGPVTRWLILLNIGFFALESAFGETMVATFALWPIGRFDVAELHAVVGFHVWQLVTSAFLHASLVHLFLKSLILLTWAVCWALTSCYVIGNVMRHTSAGDAVEPSRLSQGNMVHPEMGPALVVLT